MRLEEGMASYSFSFICLFRQPFLFLSFDVREACSRTLGKCLRILLVRFYAILFHLTVDKTGDEERTRSHCLHYVYDILVVYIRSPSAFSLKHWGSCKHDTILSPSHGSQASAGQYFRHSSYHYTALYCFFLAPEPLKAFLTALQKFCTLGSVNINPIPRESAARGRAIDIYSFKVDLSLLTSSCILKMPVM